MSYYGLRPKSTCHLPNLEILVATLYFLLVHSFLVTIELRAADRQKALHHVIAVPCNPSLATDFFAAPRERSIASGLRKRWRTAGTPNAQAMKEHRHLARLLLPLMSGVAAGNASRGGPAGVEIS
jgi:hypothetical protein